MENSQKFHVRLNAIESLAKELLEETAKVRTLLLPEKKQSSKKENTLQLAAAINLKRKISRDRRNNKKNL